MFTPNRTQVEQTRNTWNFENESRTNAIFTFLNIFHRANVKPTE